MKASLIAALILAGLGVVGAGMLLGLFFTWSNAVLPGMDRVPAESAVAVMVSANDAIKNPVIGLVFGGTPLVLAAASACALAGRSFLGAVLPLVACACVLAVVGVTAAANLPLNDALAVGGETADDAWSAFAGNWLRWNAVRIAASGAGLGTALAGVVVLARSL